MIVICVLCVNKRVSDRERNITNTVHGYTWSLYVYCVWTRGWVTESETELMRYKDIHDRYMCTVCEQEGEWQRAKQNYYGTRIYMIVICVLCENKRVSDRERNRTTTVQGYTWSLYVYCVRTRGWVTESETELMRYNDIHDRYMCTVCEQEGEWQRAKHN